MPLVDLAYRFIYDVAPLLMLLCVAVGAGVMWRRTKRGSSLVQFIGALLIFAGFTFQQLRWQSVTPYDQSVYADVMRSEPMRIGMGFAFYIGCLAFAISYVRFALTHKRI
jgi:hypothetical protein